MSTLSYMFWGYAAAFLLIAAYVARLGIRLGDLERRSERIEQGGREEG